MPTPNTRVFLSSILASNGGVKIAPSTTGDFVPLTPGVPVAQWLASTADMNGDGRADLLISAPGTAEGSYVLFTPTNWQPDNNVYGTDNADAIGLGYLSGVHAVGDGADNIMGPAGNDTIFTAGGEDTIDAIAGGKDDAFLWGGTSATKNGLWFSYDSAANVTHVYGDTDGNVGTIEFQVDLAGNIGLTQADFLL